MVFAKTSKAASRLSEQIRNKDFHKKYLAIVDGKMEEKTGHFEDYLYKIEKNNTSRIAKPNEKNAKFASLDYEVIKYNEEIDMSVVSVDLHTGRHHQIRVQFASRRTFIIRRSKIWNKRTRKAISFICLLFKL